MTGRRRLWIAVALLATVVACSGPKRTPPEVQAQYQALLGALDDELPGEGIARLTSFRNRNGIYKIAADVDAEIERLRAIAEGRYHRAREYARAGHFDVAESMLVDLATHLPETPDGQSAEEHLDGPFQVHKAQWLASRQRWGESEEVARPTLERGVPPAMAEQLETLLDGAGLAGAAMEMANRSQVQAACRQVVVALEITMVEEGEYPVIFSLADIERWDPIGIRSIRRTLSAIDGYRRTPNGYALACVSADGNYRVRVEDGVIEP